MTNNFSQPARKLFRNTDDKMIGGVCSGIAETYGFDTTLVRLLTAASCLLPGPQFLLYIIAWIIIPAKY